jgi:hypothetical protein
MESDEEPLAMRVQNGKSGTSSSRPQRKTKPERKENSDDSDSDAPLAKKPPVKTEQAGDGKSSTFVFRINAHNSCSEAETKERCETLATGNI